MKLEKSAGVSWAREFGAKPVPPLGRAERDQLAKLSSVPPSAQPTMTVLADLARRPAAGQLDELVQVVPDNRAAEPAALAGYRVGVYGLAALGRADKLADLLTSTSNPGVRQTAAQALVPALAADPELAGPMRRQLVEQKQLSATEADEVFRLLRGLSPADRADPATVDRLLADLQSTALPLRELALVALIGMAEPEERARVTAPPFVYDVAGSEEAREAGQKAWKRRGDDLKKRMAKEPPPKLGRDVGP